MKRKNIIIAVAAVIFVLAITAVFLLTRNTEPETIKPTILFYKIEDSKQTVLKKAIVEKFKSDEEKAEKENTENTTEEKEQNTEKKEIQFSFKSCNDDVTLANFLNKNKDVSFIIARNSAELFADTELFEDFSNEDFNALPSTFENNIFTDKKIAYPFLLDTYQICTSKNLLNSTEFKRINNIEDWTKFLRYCKASVDYPMVCIGSNDDTLLYLITSIMNLNGKIKVSEDYNEFVKDPAEIKDIPAGLKEALDVLVSWRKEGLLHPEWFRLEKADVEVFMEFKSTAIAFMSLSEQRTLKQEALEDFSVKCVPTPLKLEKKNLPCKTYFIAKRKINATDDTTEEKTNINKNLELEEKIIKYFTTDEGQAFISKHTRLAPTNSSAKTYDAQASDSRYWAASSNMVIPDFSEIVGNLSKEEKENLLKTIRLYIEVNGVGFKTR